MDQVLLDTIKSKGYWRINFKPIVLPEGELSLNSCRSMVESSSVELRGWDYPHISTRNDQESGRGPAGTHWHNWINWGNHKEFWNFYKTSQYLHYLALREHWLEQDIFGDGRRPAGAPDRPLSIVGTIYQITEIFEFIFRLYSAGNYKSGAEVSISLYNARNMELWLDESNRIPFSYPRTTLAEIINVRRDLLSTELGSRDHKISRGVLVEIFDNFGWSVSEERIEVDQSKFLKRQF